MRSDRNKMQFLRIITIHKEKVYRLACSHFEGKFYSTCHQLAVQLQSKLLENVLSIFADVGNFGADFDALHSSKHNENECIL